MGAGELLKNKHLFYKWILEKLYRKNTKCHNYLNGAFFNCEMYTMRI